MKNDTDTFATGPAGVVARIEHNNQPLTVVKLQEAMCNSQMPWSSTCATA
ncbi:hypothetical protein [Hymenobacter fodinae]|nr:hypothetical protein [Hymenobacter fodinae]